MKQVIYIDILVIVNLFVNYFLLLATAKFFCIRWKTSRLIFGEIIGGIYSLYIFIPEPPIFISLIIKLLMSVTIIGAVFGIKKPIFLKLLFYFYIVNFAVSGSMTAIWCIFKPKGMEMSNGIIYINISPLVLIISTLVSYIILEITNRIVNRRKFEKKLQHLKIKFRDKQTKITAKIDTGSTLKEPFSNLPVIVAKESSVKSLLPQDIYNQAINFLKDKSPAINILNLKMRVVPFKTISEEGLLPAFKPDFIKINESDIKKEAYIALCPNNFMPTSVSALINPDVLD